MAELTGRCICNTISFTVYSEPIGCRICWCHDCQHISGNGTVNILVSTDNLLVTGKISEFKKQADSGNEITRQFCPTCGVHLFAKSSARPELTVIRMGNLDKTSSVKPTANIWAASAPEWACLDDSLDQVEHQPAAPPKTNAAESKG